MGGKEPENLEQIPNGLGEIGARGLQPILKFPENPPQNIKDT